jgi:hypothetical protein
VNIHEIRDHTWSYDKIRQNTSEYVRIRQCHRSRHWVDWPWPSDFFEVNDFGKLMFGSQVEYQWNIVTVRFQTRLTVRTHCSVSWPVWELFVVVSINSVRTTILNFWHKDSETYARVTQQLWTSEDTVTPTEWNFSHKVKGGVLNNLHGHSTSFPDTPIIEWYHTLFAQRSVVCYK